MKQSVSGIYQKLKGTREAYVTRAKSCAKLTIPSLFPETDSNGETLYVPYQGIGARALKSLASKIQLSLFPPENSFFRLTVEPTEREKLGVDSQGKLDQALTRLERMVNDYLELKNIKNTAFEAIKQLIVSGNALIYMGKESFKMFRLDKYVVQRDMMGEVELIIVEEPLFKADLPKSIQKLITDDDPKQKTVKVYTCVRRQKGKWVSDQYLEDVLIPSSHAEYAIGRCPWIPLRMVQVSGEDYGRSYVEEHIGDLSSLETLSKSMSESAKAAARIVWLVRPNGITDLNALNRARNGAYVAGNPEDLVCLQFNKQADMAITKTEADEIRRGISQAFLMQSSLQRSGERVTAEEIRTLASELEQVLGGVYSLLSMELLMPIVSVAIGRLEADGVIPSFPKGTFKPSIVTGVDALGRGQDYQRLVTAMNTMAPMGEAAMTAVDMGELWSRVLASLNVPERGLIKSAEQLDNERKQEQAAQLMQVMGPQALQMQAQQQ